MSDELRWNKRKHDEEIESHRAATDRIKAMSEVQRAYLTWKKNCVRRKKSVKELVAEVYRLHGEIGKILERYPDLKEFRNDTMGWLEDKVSLLTLSNGGQKNILFEYVAGGLTTALAMPQGFTFDSEDQFKLIPLVERFTKRDGFVGFLRHGKWIKALFNDDEIVNVGLVLNLKGVERFPSPEQMRDAMRKHHEERQENDPDQRPGESPKTL